MYLVFILYSIFHKAHTRMRNIVFCDQGINQYPLTDVIRRVFCPVDMAYNY
jgi:hypothetical protein